MRISLFFIAFLFLACGNSFAQGEIIPWSADRKLKWSDFRGTYLKTEWAVATTASSISYRFSTQEKEGQWYVNFEVGCEFYPDKSWYKPDQVDSVVLSHEQLHFDISELYARKLRKRLSETQFTSNIKEEVKTIYQKLLKELYVFQNKYDRETNFSRDGKQQLIWNDMIAKALKEEGQPSQ
ncbi:MAG: DUF922 domain-containing protein [Pseudozobellia sp.]|nr:DUF922 domain-containing protein [Pseudozobellia sp.]MBG50257.1 DUF922 domain-containing protein [Pseudozobellia sp.]|tara:strand:+ start:60119 stop:60661 length:543 start_codon:yes stop_codon:yes gene_type:complete